MESVVVAQVDGNVWDLDRPLEADCKLKFLIFEDKDGVLTVLKFSKSKC